MVENKLLPPGTYVWKRLDSLANRNIVQISNEETHRVEATVIAIPNSRDEPSDANEVDYWETPKGYPRAVRAWFLPGDTFGQGFPYPAKMAMILPKPAPFLQARPGADPEANHSSARTTSLASGRKVVERSSNAGLASKETFPPGSWAVISEGTPASESSKKIAAKQAATLWDTLRRLPLTATMAPLFALVGTVALLLFGLSFVRRRRLGA